MKRLTRSLHRLHENLLKDTRAIQGTSIGQDIVLTERQPGQTYVVAILAQLEQPYAPGIIVEHSIKNRGPVAPASQHCRLHLTQYFEGLLIARQLITHCYDPWDGRANAA